MWDLSILQGGVRVCGWPPATGGTAALRLREALAVGVGRPPSTIPEGDVGEDIPAVDRRGGVDVLAVPAELTDDVLLAAVGSFAKMALAVADRLRNQGIGVTLLELRAGAPVPAELGEARPRAGWWSGQGQRRTEAVSVRRCQPRCAAPRSMCRAAIRCREIPGPRVRGEECSPRSALTGSSTSRGRSWLGRRDREPRVSEHQVKATDIQFWTLNWRAGRPPDDSLRLHRLIFCN